MRRDSNKSHLVDFCHDILKLVLKMRVANDFGDLAAFRKKIKEMIGQMETNAQRSGFPAEETQYAKFALIAFVDELIITSDWPGREDWIANPLQMESYGRFDAGEEFYKKLDEFQSQPERHKAVLELYFICLGLGFKGKYALDTRENLVAVIDRIYNGLKRFFGDKKQLLSPSAVANNFIPHSGQKLSLWYFGFGAIILCVIFYLIITLISINAIETSVNLLPR